VATRRTSSVLPSSRRRATGLPAMATPTAAIVNGAMANLHPTVGLLCRDAGHELVRFFQVKWTAPCLCSWAERFWDRMSDLPLLNSFRGKPQGPIRQPHAVTDRKNLNPSWCIFPASTRRMTGSPRLAPTLRAVSMSLRDERGALAFLQPFGMIERGSVPRCVEQHVGALSLPVASLPRRCGPGWPG